MNYRLITFLTAFTQLLLHPERNQAWILGIGQKEYKRKDTYFSLLSVLQTTVSVLPSLMPSLKCFPALVFLVSLHLAGVSLPCVYRKLNIVKYTIQNS